jgi:protein-L-isoaspartate(D-aspartate) O-methyltransferase
MPIDYAKARQNMVDGQIRTNKVIDARIVAAFTTIPREHFLPPHLQPLAYLDEDLLVGEGRFLLDPMVFARLLQAAAITPSDVVLDIGCLSGYSAAVIARLAAMVIGIESDGDKVDEATMILTDSAVSNVAVVLHELTEGYAEQGPYQVIILEGAVAEVPHTLLAQLADGGRLAAVVRTDPMATGQAVLYVRSGDLFATRVLFDANCHYLPGFAPKPQFVF